MTDLFMFIIVIILCVLAAEGVVKVINLLRGKQEIDSGFQVLVHIGAYSLTFLATALLLFGELKTGWRLIVYIGVLITAFFSIAIFIPMFTSFLFRGRESTLRSFLTVVLVIATYITVVLLLGKFFGKTVCGTL